MICSLSVGEQQEERQTLWASSGAWFQHKADSAVSDGLLLGCKPGIKQAHLPEWLDQPGPQLNLEMLR